jgi:hypothetical protein
LPDFSWCNIRKLVKNYQTTTKLSKWPYNLPISRKIYQMTIKSTSIFHYNTRYLGFWVWNYLVGNNF